MLGNLYNKAPWFMETGFIFLKRKGGLLFETRVEKTKELNNNNKKNYNIGMWLLIYNVKV